MDDELHQAFSHELRGMIEDAITAGGFDAAVRERFQLLSTRRQRSPRVRGQIRARMNVQR